MDNNLAFVSKTYWDLVGEWGEDGEPDLSYHCCPAVRIGTSLGIQRTDRLHGLGEAQQPRVADTGKRLNDLLPKGVTEWSDLRYGVDWGAKYRGWSLTNEFYLRNLYDFAGADVDDLFDWGYYVQLGRFIVPKKLEVAGRYSTVIGDSGTLGGSEHSGDEVAGTINWYIRGHNLKFQFDVSHYNGAVLSSGSGNFRAGDEGFLFRSQIQVYY